MAVAVSRDEVIAFRLAAHNLTERLSDDRLLEAAGRCAVQNSPPGSALLALHARVRGLTQQRVTESVAAEKSLLQTWCMRGAPFYLPVADAAVFTTGVLPPTEATMRHFLPGVDRPLRELGLSLSEAVDLAGAEVGEVLPGRRLAVDALGAEVAERVADKLSGRQRHIWLGEGPYAPGQSLGEGVVHFCLRILTLHAVLCLAARERNTAPLVLVEEWLGHPIPRVDPAHARAELLRRYLRCYGPSTRGDFAAWVGVQAVDTGHWWTLIQDELTPVAFGRDCWMLSRDLDALRTAPPPRGVRLLPPRDPYTQTPDHDTIVGRAHQPQVWKATGAPGTLLVDGEVVGTWRARLLGGRRLAITITPFASLPASAGRQVEAEANAIAALRGASSVDVTYDDRRLGTV